jgi:hypothetical protein
MAHQNVEEIRHRHATRALPGDDSGGSGGRRGAWRWDRRERDAGHLVRHGDGRTGMMRGGGREEDVTDLTFPTT